MRTWQTEFGSEYQCPPKPAGFTDSSWHNEAYPSYMLTHEDHEIRIWMQHPAEPEHDGRRFLVSICEFDCESTDLVETDDFAMAVACCWLAKALLGRGMDHKQIDAALEIYNEEKNNG